MNTTEINNGYAFVIILIAIGVCFFVAWGFFLLSKKIIINSKDKLKNTTLEGLLKLLLIFGTISVCLSVIYYLIYSPIVRQNSIKYCNKEAYDNSRDKYKDSDKKAKYEEIYQRCLREKGF
jgi:hypothetical protein